MTVAELHVALRFGLDKLDSSNYPNLEDEEVDLILNQAQERFIKQRYGLNNIKRQSFEETQKRTEDLKNIVENAVITPAVNAATNIDTLSRFVTLPADHFLILQERCSITYNNAQGDSTTLRVRVKAIDHDDYNVLTEDPFNKPDTTNVLRILAKGKVELIPASNVTLNNYYLRYLRLPLAISLTGNQTSELSEHTHQELVDMAILIALEAIEAQRNKTFPEILNTNE